MAISFLTQAQRDSIVELYIAYFNRAPEAAGLNSWSAVVLADMNAGKTSAEALKNIANQFYAAGVQYNLYSSAQTVESFISTAYANALGRTSVDAAGMTYWSLKLVSGEVSRGEFVQSLIRDAKAFAGDATWGWVSTYMANRVAVGNAFADNSASLTGAAAITAGTTALSGVTAALAQAGQTAAQAVAAFTAPAAVTGQTFTLTTGVDTGALFTGGTGNDSFTATHLTLNASDVINGGAGIDTLNYTDSGTAGGALAAALTSNIEIINVRNVNGTAGTAAVVAVTEVSTVNFTQAFVNTNTVVIAGRTFTVGAGNATAVEMATAVSTNAATANIAVTGTLTGYTAAAGGTTTSAVLTSTVAGNVVDLTTSGSGAGVVTAITAQGIAAVGAVAGVGVTDTLAAGNFAGATDFNSNLSTNDLTITGMVTGQSVGMIGNGAATNGALTATYASGTATTVNISGGTTAGAVTLNGGTLLSTTINSTGAANVIGAFVDAASSKALTVNATTGLTTTSIGDSAARTAITINATGDVVTGAVTSSAAVTAAITGTGKVTSDFNLVVAPTITVAGSGAVVLGTLNNLAATVTSTQTAGSLTLTAGSLVTAKITGGAGNDVITSAAILTTGFIDGGAGTDTLIVGNVNQVNTTTLGAKYTNFETLRLAGTLDVSLISGIAAIETTGTVTLSGMSAVQAAAVTVRGNFAGSSTFALTTATGTSDVLNLKMGTGLTTSSATNATGAVVVTGFETLNITVAAGATATTAGALLSSFDTAFTGATLKAVNLFGSAVSIADAATTVAATFDASALTGDANATNLVTAAATKGLTLAGSLASGSTVTGSNFIDTITIGATGAAGSTYNLGAGADAISTSFANLHTGAIYNNIDGGAGIDTVTLTGGGVLTMVDADFKGLTNIEKVTIATTAGNAQSITTGGFFDTNFKTVGATLTTTSSTGAIVVDESTFSGTNAVTATSSTGAITISGGSGNNTIITTSVGTAAAEGRTTITTLGGNDTVTVNLANATTTNVISLGAGNDTFTHVTGTGSMAITGGTGADVMTGLAGGIETYKFANTGDSGTPAASNFDTIINWTTAEDIIDFTGALTMVANATTGSAGVAAISAGSIATFNAADSTLALRIIAVEAAMTKSSAAANAGVAPTALNVTTFNFGTDAYVFVTNGTAGVDSGDTLIKLTGVSNTGTFTISGGGDITAIS